MSGVPSEFLEFDIEARDANESERLCAEAWEHGACGIEERTGESLAPLLRIWAPSGRAESLRRALGRLLGPGARVGAARPVETDWSQAWREGLGPVRVSERLVVRPSFAEHAAAPGEHVIVVDPAQAFGTGHHASTRLALALLDAELRERGPGVRVLDVGTGSGVLVLAALALGAEQALGFDLDPLAAPEARRNARVNDLVGRARFVTGPIDALREQRFDVVVANLMRGELLPLLEPICARLAPGGALLLAGLLAPERPLVEAELERRSLRVHAAREESAGDDTWLGLAARWTPAP